MRAYAAAAGSALDAADVRTVIVTARVTVRHAYDQSGAIAAALAATGYQPVAVEYLEDVTLVFDVPIGDVDRFRAEIVERSAGRVSVAIDPG